MIRKGRKGKERKIFRSFSYYFQRFKQSITEIWDKRVIFQSGNHREETEKGIE